MKNSKSVKTAPKVTKKEIKLKKQESMASKVDVKKPQDQEKVSKLVGSIFIILGLLLVAFGIYSFVKYNSNPKLDTSLVSPSFEEIPSITNGQNVSVAGNAKGYDTVLVYLNEEKIGSTKVNNKGEYLFNVSLGQEGEYKIAVAGVKGFPIRHLSSQSTVQTIVVDRTAPVLADIKFPTEVGTETFTVTGTAEKDAQVTVKRGTDYYSATCNEKGYFKIVSVALDNGANVFNVVIKDTAGNETALAGRIKVIYSPESTVNGDAVNDESIPVADGDMENVADFLAGNKLVWLFAILALVGGITTTSVMYIKQRKQ